MSFGDMSFRQKSQGRNFSNGNLDCWAFGQLKKTEVC
jgi:hypothetical protein